MEQSRPKRVKTSATRVRRREVGSPSARTVVTPTIHSFCKRPYGEIPRSETYIYTRNTNHAQPTVNDLRFMYAVKNNVMINWPEEILKIMNSVSLSQSKLLPYSIFISRIVDYLRIDVSDTIIVEYTDKDHLYLAYQEDYTTFGLDLSDDDNQDDTDNQHATAQGSLLDQHLRNLLLDSINWKLWSNGFNNRMDLTSKD
ncbi:hypothetical protein Lal_00044352 [Lupinus albus]|nr:hypothetical protein Lal_00044352 [Lupinus albus]